MPIYPETRQPNLAAAREDNQRPDSFGFGWFMRAKHQNSTYPVEDDGDGAVSIKGRLVAAQLRDLADDGDQPANKAVEIGGRNARR